MGPTSKILIFCDYFVPGYRAGGPIRSIETLAKLLARDHQVYVITRAWDMGESALYADLQLNAFIDRDGYRVCYLDREHMSIAFLTKMVSQIQPNIIYINSLFSLYFSIFPIWMRYLRVWQRGNILLAPRGELNAEALAYKSVRKKVYLGLSRLFSVYNAVNWHFSNEHEKTASEKVVSQISRGSCYVANDLIAKPSSTSKAQFLQKEKGALRLVFISRISPMKNLLFAIKVLTRFSANISLDIYGPTNTDVDRTYWQECQNYIQNNHLALRVRYQGPVAQDQVQQVFARYDAFILPTLGENFGHVVLESLAAGTPVLVSNRTPWTGFADNKSLTALSLDEEVFARELESLQGVDDAEFSLLREGCLALYQKMVDIIEIEQQNLAMFKQLLTSKSN